MNVLYRFEVPCSLCACMYAGAVVKKAVYACVLFRRACLFVH